MKKKDLLKRLNKLTKLIAKTEPDIEPDTHLFSQHSITHEKNIMRIQEEKPYSVCVMVLESFSDSNKVTNRFAHFVLCHLQ